MKAKKSCGIHARKKNHVIIEFVKNEDILLFSKNKKISNEMSEKTFEMKKTLA